MIRKVHPLLLLLLLAAGPLRAGDITSFTFTDLDGTVYSSVDLVGTPLVINIGSHW